jgi:hypothetical protein
MTTMTSPASSVSDGIGLKTMSSESFLMATMMTP